MRKIIFTWVCTFLQAFPINSLAQQSIFKTYTVSDGLVNNSVRRVFQDSKGFLWIATWEGLSKYDGNRFTNFTESNGLSHSMVNDIAETPGGNIYVAMNNGSVDVIKNDKVEQKGVLQNVIINRLHLTKEKKLLALTDFHGIIEVDGKNIRQLTSPGNNGTYGLVTLHDSLIAAASFPDPVSIYDKQFHLKAFIKPKAEPVVANCIYNDLQNKLWLGTNRGLKLISVNERKDEIKFGILPLPFNDPILSQANISAIFQQENGVFWVGTDQGLINIFPNGKIIRLTEKDGLPSKAIGCIFNDREDNLWIGTSLGLVKIIAQSPVQLHDLSQGPYSIALIIKKITNDELLISSGGFLYRYNFKTGKAQNALQLQKGAKLVFVANSSPPILLYQNQLNNYDIASSRLKPIAKVPSPENFFTAATDNKAIFIGLFNGIMIYANEKFKLDSAFRMRIETIITDHKGFVWIGTWDKGLYRARFDTKTEKWSDVTYLSQLPDGHVRSLFEDSKGNIWVGTRYRGVVRITGNSGHFELTNYNQQKGLSSNRIGDITEDGKGNIWLSSGSGLDKLVNKVNHFEVFNFSRAMNFSTISNLIIHVEGNKLLCSTINGMFLITDNEFEQLPPKPVYLTKINLGTIDEKQLASGDGSKKIVLPYSKNHALFEFTSLSYVNEKEILYSYRLGGSTDTAWSHPSNSHSVQYASLEPGHYRFEVRMLGWNGSYGPITSFLFNIKPPYWNTWWFYSLVVLFILLAMYSLYRYRINHLLRLQKVRNTIATDLHDDIGSTLTNISILSELSKKNLQEPRAAEKLLQRITEESAASQQALDDIIWSVNTSNDNMQELQARMRRYVAEVFESSNISCQFNFENVGEGGRLNMEQRRDLYLVFKECMNNIHKHASAKNIYVQIAISNGVMSMLIEDDGKGFDPNITTHRNGLKNLETRVEKWKGSLKIDTAFGTGTKIQIMMPVKTSLLK